MPRSRLIDVEPEAELPPEEEFPEASPAGAPQPELDAEAEVPKEERCRAGGRHDWVVTHDQVGIQLLGCRNCHATRGRAAPSGSASYSFGRAPGEGGGF